LDPGDDGYHDGHAEGPSEPILDLGSHAHQKRALNHENVSSHGCPQRTAFFVKLFYWSNP